MEQTFSVKQVKGKDVTNSDIFWWEAAQQWQCVEASMLNGVFFTQDKTYLVKVTPEYKSAKESEFDKKNVWGGKNNSITSIIDKRIDDAFSDGCHNHERNRLIESNKAIKELIPPSYFTEFASYRPKIDRDKANADVRNSLSPFKNLAVLCEGLSQHGCLSQTENTTIDLIQREAKVCKEAIGELLERLISSNIFSSSTNGKMREVLKDILDIWNDESLTQTDSKNLHEVMNKAQEVYNNAASTEAEKTGVEKEKTIETLKLTEQLLEEINNEGEWAQPEMETVLKRIKDVINQSKEQENIEYFIKREYPKFKPNKVRSYMTNIDGTLLWNGTKWENATTDPDYYYEPVN